MTLGGNLGKKKEPLDGSKERATRFVVLTPRDALVTRSVTSSASASVLGQRGVSPFQVRALRPVTKGNCVLARGGGKQLEVNDQSVTQVNSIRPVSAASLLDNGEAQTGATRKSTTLRGSVLKRSWGERGGWGRNGWKARHMKQRDLGDNKTAFMLCEPKSRSPRSQSTHSSDETG